MLGRAGRGLGRGDGRVAGPKSVTGPEVQGGCSAGMGWWQDPFGEEGFRGQGWGQPGQDDLGTPAPWNGGGRASRGATGSCSITGGDFPYLPVFAGGLEPGKGLAFLARWLQPRGRAPQLLFPLPAPGDEPDPNPSAASAVPNPALLLRARGRGDLG